MQFLSKNANFKQIFDQKIQFFTKSTYNPPPISGKFFQKMPIFYGSTTVESDSRKHSKKRRKHGLVDSITDLEFEGSGSIPP
jgi:hypothetical protein